MSRRDRERGNPARRRRRDRERGVARNHGGARTRHDRERCVARDHGDAMTGLLGEIASAASRATTEVR